MNQQIQPAEKLDGTLSLPADKSISHRSAMFAALHDGSSTIMNFSEAADPHSTLYCLRQLGVEIEEKGSTIIVKGVGRDGFKTPEKDLDCGNSGTTMRLLSGIIAGSGVEARLVGDESLSSRTMRRIIDPLEKMGAEIEARNQDYAPLRIKRRSKVNPLNFPLPIPSAQLKSCILLAGLFGDGATIVVERIPSRDHTERLLRLPVDKRDGTTVISARRNHVIPNQTYRVPGDFSAAAFWLVAGSIHPRARISMKRVGVNPTRNAAMSVLENMGASLSVDQRQEEGPEPSADITVTSSALKAIEIGPHIVPNCIDEIPILAVAMLFADGISRIRGAEELRHKETDRLAAVADLLRLAGADFIEFDDGFEIKGNPNFTPKSATFNSYHDHRIAMSAAVMSLLADGKSSILDAECTAISYPDFWNHVTDLTN